MTNTQNVKKPHHAETNQVMGLQGNDHPERRPMTTPYLTQSPAEMLAAMRRADTGAITLTRSTIPALEMFRVSGDLVFELATFDRVLADCCDRPGSRVDVRLYSPSPSAEYAEPLTYAECCRDCALGVVRQMLAEAFGDMKIVAEVNR